MKPPNQNFNLIILTGMMGSGKSTVGKLMARKLNYKFIDTDKLIEQSEGLSVSQIFSLKGERHFRKIEEKVCLSSFRKMKSVISLGGGAICNSKIRQSAKKSGFVIFLYAPCSELLRRIKASRRPLIKNLSTAAQLSRLRSLYRERKKFYHQADLKLSCARKTAEQISLEALAWVRK